MAELLKAGMIGCGDYLRWEIDDLNSNRYMKVKSTFDLDNSKSRKIAGKINANAYDQFAINLQEGLAQPSDASDAIIDMQIMDEAVKSL